MQTQLLNPTQLHILQLFNRKRSKKDLEELQSVLLEYYRNKVDIEADKIWKEKKMSASEIATFLEDPKRTAYK